MQHLFQSWESCSSEIRAAHHILLLSDFDGTLTPIVDHPSEVIMPFEIREKIHTLAQKTTFTLGIISGRPLAEIKALVGISGIYYTGNHGLEIEGRGLSYVHSEAQAARAQMQQIAREFYTKLEGIDGAFVENKGLTLSVHYRLVKKEKIDAVNDIFHNITSPWLQEKKIKVNPGKKAWEIKPPVDWHKGKAARLIIDRVRASLGQKQLLTIYLGDDTTDEDAFKTIKRPAGWSILVGQVNHFSNADYFLNSVSEVGDFLSRLLELK